MPHRTYWYDTIKASNHEELREFINTAAEQGWEPIECWSDRRVGSGGGDGSLLATISPTDHFCLLRMPVEAATAK